jgi:hypothetical protein
MPRTTIKNPGAGKSNKREKVLALMRRPNGASLSELIKATSRQPHSARAVISGLRKQGHAITREARESGETCYKLAEQG